MNERDQSNQRPTHGTAPGHPGMNGADPLYQGLGAQNPDGRARAAALAAVSAFQPRSANSVNYRSAGRLLVVGEHAAVVEALGRLAGQLECTVLLPSESPSEVSAGLLGEVPRLSGYPASLSGHLGAFQVEFATPSGTLSLSAASGGGIDHFDLVLDLSAEGFIPSALPPPGYFAPRGDPAALDRALGSIPGLVGQFEKPQYFAYDPAICAHGRSGIQACTACLDACPADAIRSAGDRIEVDPNLCQGAGSCATACPTGAIGYAYPRLGDTLARLRAMLKAYRAAGGLRPRLLFFGQESDAATLARMAARLPEQVLPFPVEDVGSVGMDLWLAGLAYGAHSVTLLAGDALPASVAAETRAQLTSAGALLEGMGYAPHAIGLLLHERDDATLRALGETPEVAVAEAAGFAPLDDKRRVLHLAIDHLHQHAPAARPMVTLPVGAPFGEVWLEKARCTLCMACVSQCPGKALEAGGETPQLRFIEDNCVQCALCARSCPEDAIAPTPRYLFDSAARQQRRVLKEEEPFRCVACGKPFATRSVIEKMTAKLSTHPMFREAGALDRLRMCEDCRVKSMLREETDLNHMARNDGGEL